MNTTVPHAWARVVKPETSAAIAASDADPWQVVPLPDHASTPDREPGRSCRVSVEAGELGRVGAARLGYSGVTRYATSVSIPDGFVSHACCQWP